jgi:hypothetical protein
VFLHGKSPAWHLVGRVHFNLAENRRDDEAPFAFLATYTTRLSTNATAQHLPLGRALSEYAGAANKGQLLSLLLPVQRAATECPWLKAMVESGEIATNWRFLSGICQLPIVSNTGASRDVKCRSAKLLFRVHLACAVRWPSG